MKPVPDNRYEEMKDHKNESYHAHISEHRDNPNPYHEPRQRKPSKFEEPHHEVAPFHKASRF